MSRGHARTSRTLGAADPRHSRGQGQAFNEAVQVGNGLEVDRQGRIAVKPGAAVQDLPLLPKLADVVASHAALLDSLKRAGFIEG